MIRNIIFDMGRVLIQWNTDLFMERMGVPPEDRPLFAREAYLSVEWIQMDRGTLTPEEGVEAICARLPERLHRYVRAMILDWWKDPLIPMEGMEELIAELKGKGYGIYLLSNATRELHKYFPSIPASRYFDGLVVSADYKQLKPEREIYQTLFRKFDLIPQECLFIDDLCINVEGGKFAGMEGIIFRGDVGLLRQQLRAAGVPVELPSA